MKEQMNYPDFVSEMVIFRNFHPALFLVAKIYLKQ